MSADVRRFGGWELGARGVTVPLWPALGLVLVVGALWLRVGALDAIPLAPDESARALEALGILRRTVGDYSGSPLPTNLAAVSIGLFTAADGPARLPTALAGWAMCLTPLLFRSRLGGLAAGSACALLALSPLSVLASRTLHPAALVSLATMLSVGGLLAAFDRRDGRWLLLPAAGLALGLGAGGAFVAQIAAVALAFSIWPPVAGRPAFAVRTWLPRAAAVLFATALVLDTLLLTRPSGLQAGLVDPFSSWVGALGFNRATVAGGLSLLLHEPLLLVLAALGLVAAIRDDTGRFLLVWALASVTLSLLRQSPDLAELAAACLPLSLLAGLGVGRATARFGGLGLRVPTTALALVAPLVYLGVATNNAYNRGAEAPLSALAIATGGLVAVALFASTWLDRRELIAAAGLVVLVGAAAFQVTFLTRLNYAGFERAAPALLTRSNRSELRRVEARVRDWWRQDPRSPVLVDVGLRPLLEWSLRDGPPVQWIAAMPTTGERAILGADLPGTRPPGGWTRLAVGARFLRSDQWPSPAALWRWLVLRQPISKVEPYAILLPQ